MTDTPTPTSTLPWRLIAARYTAAAVLGVSLGLVLPAAVAVHLRPQCRKAMVAIGTLLALVLILCGGLGWWIDGVAGLVSGNWGGLLRAVPLAVTVAAAGAGVVAYVWDHRDYGHPLADDRRHAAALVAVRRRVDHTVTPQTRPVLPDRLVLGPVLEGSLPAATITHRRLDWLGIPADWLTHHIILCGETGTGKTVTALTIVHAALSLGWRVIYLDAKADEETRRRFEVVATAAGHQVTSFPPNPIDGWRGGPDALLGRLMRGQEWSDGYYQAVARDVLFAALNAPGADPIGDWPDLLARLDRTWLTTAWCTDEARARHLASILTHDLSGMAARYWGTASALGAHLGGTWSFEDPGVTAAYVALGTAGNTDTAVEMAAWVVEDVVHAITERLPAVGDTRPTLVVADEFSRVSERAGRGVVEAVERCRGFGCGWLIVGQDLSSLGDEEELPRILGAAGTRIAHRLSSPQAFCDLAGTVPVVERTAQTDGTGHTGLGSTRRSERYVIPPQSVRRLPDREAWVAAHGRAAHVGIVPPAALADHLANEHHQRRDTP